MMEGIGLEFGMSCCLGQHEHGLKSLMLDRVLKRVHVSVEDEDK